MAQIDEIFKERLKKLQRILKKGIFPYPIKTKRTHPIKEVLLNFEKFSKEKKQFILVGRIRSKREHGGATFLDFEDGTGKLQAFLRKDRLGEKAYKFFLENFDIGDFVEFKGWLFKTKKGERTIDVLDFKILSKSLLSLPEKWHGLKDIEERYRKRYLDLIFNPQIKEKFILRSKIIETLREFLKEKGFLEVETPILQTIYGGAKAKPFKTKLLSLNLNLYLRIAPELYLKRLIIGGFEKIFEIGKCFRNEGIDRAHNPEFTSLEFYWAFADYKMLMKFTEEMFVHLLEKLFGKLKIEYEGKVIDFTPPWPRIEFLDLLQKETKIDYETLNLKALKQEAKKLNISIEKGDQKPEVADKIFKKYCLSKIINPTFLIHHPKGAFPLAKELEKNPKKLANFQLIVGGLELVNAFSEQNDPLKQEEIFKEQEKYFKEGLKEAQRMDKDFIEALKYGMPPCAGFGLGIDRLVALLTNSHSIREIIFFPFLRPKK